MSWPGMDAGADDYVTKPLDPFTLHTRLIVALR
jgi:DNA-binding response OmpR family regulator